MAAANNELSSATQVIWGTNINTTGVQVKLKNFINNFEEIKDEEDDDNMDDAAFTKPSYYIQKLKEIKSMDQNVLDIDCDHLFQYDPSLYRQIVDYPSDIIPIFDLVVTQVFKELEIYEIGGQNGAENDQDMQFDELNQND